MGLEMSYVRPGLYPRKDCRGGLLGYLELVKRLVLPHVHGRGRPGRRCGEGQAESEQVGSKLHLEIGRA